MCCHRRAAAWSPGPNVASQAAGSAGTAVRPIGSEQGQAVAGWDVQSYPTGMYKLPIDLLATTAGVFHAA